MQELYVNFFKKIYLIRQVERKISELYSEEEIRCPIHLSIGQEAIAVGICELLKKNDHIFSSHRSHAHYLAKGGDLKSFISELYGKNGGCAHGIGGSMHLQDLDNGVIGSIPILGSAIPLATGASLFSKSSICKKKYLTVVFFGEGATEEGVFFESLNFAALKNLPILFICENNLYSVFTNINERQSKKRNLLKIVQNHGIQSYSCDGNDVLKVYNKANEAIRFIKKNNLPAFIEFKTYRYLEHCGPDSDDHFNYREIGELKYWLKRCPLQNIKKKLSRLIGKNAIKKLENNVNKKISDSFIFAKKDFLPNKKILNKFNAYSS